MIVTGDSITDKNMLDFDGLNAVIGTDALLELGRQYDADAHGGNGKAKR